MGIANLFTKLFQNKEKFDAKRFCDIYWNDTIKKSCLENVTLVTEVNENNVSGRFYGINLSDFIPQNYKITDPFDVIYDKKTNKLYAISTNGISFNAIIDNQPVTIHTSNMMSCTKATLVGKTELMIAETFND